MSNPKALHPIKVGGKWIKAGDDVPVNQLSETRLASLIAKGRAQVAPENRADLDSGRPPLDIGGTPKK